MTFSQIQVGRKGYLDISQDVVVPLNFGVASIVDISKRTGSFSKTIKLPGTANNKKLLGQLFNINVTDGSFDIKKKEDIIILKNGVPQFTGFMQLNAVNKTSPSLGLPDEIVEFEVAVKDDSGDFFNAIGDGFLDTLSDFSGLTSTFTFQNVFKTSGYTWQQKYKYYMPFITRNYYVVTDFAVATSAYAMFNNILRESGYRVDFPEVSEIGLDKLWIPYNGDTPKRDIEPLKFKASNDANNVILNFGTVYNAGVEDHYISGTIVKFNDDSTTGPTGSLSDPGNQYDTSTGIYTSNSEGVTEFSSRYVINIYYKNPLPDTVEVGRGIYFTLKINRALQVGGIVNASVNDEIFTRDFATEFQVPGGGQVLIGQLELPIQSAAFQLYQGSTVYNYLSAIVSINLNDYNNIDWIYTTASGTVSPDDYPQLVIEVVNSVVNYQQIFFKNKPSTTFTYGSPVRFSDFIPKQITRKSFISSLTKMFNLYIFSSGEDKKITIMTRDKFYDSGPTVDWTNKLAIEQEQTIEFLPDLANKVLTFTYKSDNDDFNKGYQDATKEVFGQLEYTFSSQFVKGTQKNELIFSPTPLVKNPFNQVVPAIYTTTPKNNIRILYDGGNITTPSGDGFYLEQQTSEGLIKFGSLYYPYMGHFDNPYTPTSDYNFGQADFYFYDNFLNLTNNNLYNKYYTRNLDQIENGRLYTAMFRLTELDIANLDLRCKVHVYDNIYVINKIIDYDANSVNGLTKVELVNIESVVKFISKKTNRQNIPSNVPYVLPPLGGGNAHRTSYDGENSFNNTDNGDFNIYQPNSSFNTSNGDFNSFAGVGNQTNGSQNYINGSGNLIQGSGNTIL